MMIAATILDKWYPFAFPEIAYSMITPIPVTANTAFLITDSFIFPSSVSQLFCGRRHTRILMIAEIQTIASITTGASNSGKWQKPME